MSTTVVYSNPVGDRFQVTLRAAQLVPSGGNAPLPPPYGDLPTAYIENPSRFGLRPEHPLQSRYPNIKLQYHALVVPESWMVKVGGRQGLALYEDFNGSTVAASVASANGRNAMAPYDWEGEPGSPTDAATLPYMEWRDVLLDGNIHCWQSHMRHGTTPGYDWRDGVPNDLRTMYDSLGTVRQSILVPTFYEGIGLAEQTLRPEEVNDFLSYVVFFPRQNPHVRRIIGERFGRYDRFRSFAGSMLGGGTLGGGQLETLGVGGGSYGSKDVLGTSPIRTRGGSPLRGGPSYREEAMEAELKMSSGGNVRQSFPYDGFGPSFWQREPEVALVFVPITEEQANDLNLGITIPHRRRDYFQP